MAGRPSKAADNHAGWPEAHVWSSPSSCMRRFSLTLSRLRDMEWNSPASSATPNSSRSMLRNCGRASGGEKSFKESL